MTKVLSDFGRKYELLSFSGYRVTAEKQRSTSLHSKLAKAETLLILALLTDLVIYPWLFAKSTIPPAARTVIKMALVVGLFGPLQNFISRGIDRTLKATRTVTESMFSLPRIAIHSCILGLLFVTFYWSMHHEPPWTEHGYRQARAEPR
jgi:hypothetical protein